MRSVTTQAPALTCDLRRPLLLWLWLLWGPRGQTGGTEEDGRRRGLVACLHLLPGGDADGSAGGCGSTRIPRLLCCRHWGTGRTCLACGRRPVCVCSGQKRLLQVPRKGLASDAAALPPRPCGVSLTRPGPPRS